MRKTFFLLLLLSATIFAQLPAHFSIEGHRGARGYVPENTIPSFIKALELGADTIELDVVISGDNKVLVSHEPWFNSVISTQPDGSPIPFATQREFNIFKMQYSEVAKFDVGILGNKDFPQQVKMKAHKPLLSEVFKDVNKYAKEKKLKKVRYNIEIKSNPEGDDKFHPAPVAFAKLVYDEITKAKMQKQVIVQSFDERPLRETHKLNDKLPLALLIDRSNKDGVEKNIERLGFTPDTYSPHFSLVDAVLVKFCRQRNIKIVPWTVNEIADLERMKTFVLDGIISDYPDRVVQVFKK